MFQGLQLLALVMPPAMQQRKRGGKPVRNKRVECGEMRSGDITMPKQQAELCPHEDRHSGTNLATDWQTPHLIPGDQSSQPCSIFSPQPTTVLTKGHQLLERTHWISQLSPQSRFVVGAH